MTGTTQGSIATYSCIAGFSFTGGDQVRTCQPNGQWSGSVGSCRGKFVIANQEVLILVMID